MIDLAIPCSIVHQDWQIVQLDRQIGQSSKRPIDQSPYRQMKKEAVSKVAARQLHAN